MPGKRQRVSELTMQRKVRRVPPVMAGVQALRMVRKMNAQREKKFVDTGIGFSSATPTAGLLCEIAEGDTSASRSGLQVIAKSVRLTGSVFVFDNNPLGEDFQDQPLYCHIAIVVDKRQVSNTPPSWESIWTGDPVQGVLKDRTTGDAFRVLREKRIVLNGSALAKTHGIDGTSYTNGVMLDWNIPLKDLRIGFNGTAGDSIEKNGVYVTFKWLRQDLSSAAIGDVDTRVRFRATARLKYVDP